MEQLRSRVRAFLAEVSPPAAVRRLMEDDRGFDLDVWLRLAADYDLLSLPTWSERAVVLEETGRVLLCAPYLATLTAAPFLPPELGEAAAGGLCVASLALAEASGGWDAEGVRTRAVAGGGRWWLEGEKSYVVDGCAADVLVVAARPDGEDGVALFLVDAGGAGVDRSPLATVDQTRRQALVRLSAAPARHLDGSLDAAIDLCAVALAAEQVGGAARALEMAVEYAGRRVQFGRPIGSFQAVKHLCAGMLLEVESARGAAEHAAAAADAGAGHLADAAPVAKVACSEAFVRVATDSLHVHGGLGFTWDHDAHLYLRRARSSYHLFGDPRHHRERLARRLGL